MNHVVGLLSPIRNPTLTLTLTSARERLFQRLSTGWLGWKTVISGAFMKAASNNTMAMLIEL